MKFPINFAIPIPRRTLFLMSRSGSYILRPSGAFFFIWILLALGVTALFSVILSARALWEQLPKRTDEHHKQSARA